MASLSKAKVGDVGEIRLHENDPLPWLNVIILKQLRYSTFVFYPGSDSHASIAPGHHFTKVRTLSEVEKAIYGI